IAAFRSGTLEFQVITTHIIFGGGNDARSMQRRVEEIEKLGEYLQTRSRYAQNPLFLMGDFQVERPDSPLLQALRDSGVHIPDHLLLPSNLDQTKYYSQIGFVDPDRQPSYSFGEERAGAVDFFRYVYRSEDLDTYLTSAIFKEYNRQPYFKGKAGTKKEQERRYWFWKTYLMSDHLPLWVELELHAWSPL
ncbi:MAG TPA: hypothetical protein VJ933_03200, partial [Phaeodactylibacter sp.]|nr:hypothetical protein [Phaeodactylibacter sp.]